MPYSNEHKDRTRARGGFYHHFGSMDELHAAVASFTNCNPFRPNPANRAPAELVRMVIDVYLSDEVLDNIDFHCPLYALPGDIARAGLSPQQVNTQLIRNLTHVMCRRWRMRRTASSALQAIVSLCVGGMVLARMTDDSPLRRAPAGLGDARHQLTPAAEASDCVLKK